MIGFPHVTSDGLYNSFMYYHKGNYQIYRKINLFPPMNEAKVFQPGTALGIFETKFGKVGAAICYDLRFPVWCRNKGDYDCLIFVANWPEARSDAWKSLLVARAHENQCYVTGVNRTGTDGKGVAFSGDSAVFGPRGNLLCAIKPNEESVKTLTFSYNELADFRNKFPVGLDADEFTIC